MHEVEKRTVAAFGLRDPKLIHAPFRCLDIIQLP